LNRYAIANWKMNVPAEGIGKYLGALAGRDGIVISPPFPYLKEVAARVATAAQNCSDQISGAYTGEVSAGMVRDCGATFAIIGHSERRKWYGDTNEIVARKVARAVEAGLTPILCVGEDQGDRDGGREAQFVRGQLQSAATALEAARDIVITYEPVWAIGTGRNATGEMVSAMAAEIRSVLREFGLARADAIPILYGGSVTPENVHDIGRQGGIAGYLVGGACLESRTFLPICESLERLPAS
jgi:triosephosphate isomerase